MNELELKSLSIAKIVWQSLLSREKGRLAIIWLLIVLGMILETMSLGLVIPLIGLMSDDKYVRNVPVIGRSLTEYSANAVVLIMMGIFVAVFVIKAVFMYLSIAVQKRFSFEASVRLCQLTFETYLQQPYGFHLQQNSSTLVRNIENARLLVAGGLDPFLVLITDGLIALGLFALMLIVEPVGTAGVLILLSISVVIFQASTRKPLKSWGVARKVHAGKVLQHLQQGMHGVKDIKILGRERKFLKDHQQHLITHLDAERRFALLQSLPKIFFELVAIIGMAFVVVLMILTGDKISDVVITLGLFAAIAFRVIPSAGRVVASVQTIDYNGPIIRNFFADSQLPRPELEGSTLPMQFNNSIMLQNVSFCYADSSRNALESVSLTISCGEAIGIIGASGAGKSTLVDVILGLLPPSSGSIEVDGYSISSNLRGWQQLIGYVPQSIYLVDDSIRKNIAFGVPDLDVDEAAVRRAVNAAQLDEFVDSLPDGLDTVVGERGVRLSGGQRQRIGIARALYHDPKVLVLDEATSSLDSETEHGVMEAVRKLQGSKTILIIAHRVSTVGYCNTVYRFEEGKLVGSGSPSLMTGLGDSAES